MKACSCVNAPCFDSCCSFQPHIQFLSTLPNSSLGSIFLLFICQACRAPQSSSELRRASSPPPLHGRRAGIIGNNGEVLARVNHSGRNGAKVGGARRGRGAKGERKDDEEPERLDGRQKVSRGRRRRGGQKSASGRKRREEGRRDEERSSAWTRISKMVKQRGRREGEPSRNSCEPASPIGWRLSRWPLGCRLFPSRTSFQRQVDLCVTLLPLHKHTHTLGCQR